MDSTKVLIVDDDRDVVNLVRLALARAGIRSDFALSAEDALARMRAQVYAVVLVDIHLQGLSGVELLKELKKCNSLVQVIMLTSDASMERVIECLDCGATDFFSKTGPLHSAVEAVSLALGRAARWTSWLGTRTPTAAGSPM